MSRHTCATESQRDNAAMQDEVGKMFKAREKANKRREPDERPFIGSLGDCLVQTAHYKPLGYAKITALVRGADGLMLHLEPDTAAMFDAPVTIFVRAGIASEQAREILKEAARCLKGYDTLEPWTPREFLKSTPFADDESVAF